LERWKNRSSFGLIIGCRSLTEVTERIDRSSGSAGMIAVRGCCGRVVCGVMCSVKNYLPPRKLTRDPRVRHRSQELLLLADEHFMSEIAGLLQTARHRVRAWRDRYLAQGIPGLADKRRMGRPPKLGVNDLALLVVDLRELLLQLHGLKVCRRLYTGQCLKIGYRYRRPRHDLTHRQDAEAVALAREVLECLKKEYQK